MTIAEEVKDKNEELVKYTSIEGTPFTYVSHTGGHFITLGNYRLTEVYDNEFDALAQVRLDNWQFLMGVIASIVEHAKNNNK